MVYLLPTSIEEAKRLLSQLFEKAKFGLAVLLCLILIAALPANGKQPSEKLISQKPVSQKSISQPVTALQSFYPSVRQNITPAETFAFVPDLARNKFPKIDLHGLTYLSFFDIPLTENGEINYDSKGYQSFASDDTTELFNRAHNQNTKIFVTLSALNEDTIKNLLDNPDAQQRLADQAVEKIWNSNIDGITVDFEMPNGGGKDYQEKFTNFISLLTNTIRDNAPDAQIAVAVPSSQAYDDSLYNLTALGDTSDRIFLIASNLIVPEVRDAKLSNPVFGYDEQEYFTNVSNLLNNQQTKVPADKLVMERAWYGNGDNYPLYVPNAQPEPEENRQTFDVQLDQDTVEKLVAGVPEKGKAAARENIPLIAEALDKEGILDSNVLAYALATIEHETDETFQPIEEIQGPISARRLGYEGGTNFFGRGFIQITHLRNYREFGERIGLGDQLVKNPELALNAEVSAKILAAFFKDNNVANLASNGNFVAARAPVNPDYNGYSIAQKALKYNI